MEELAGRLATVRPFLPLLMDTVTFGATGDGPTDAVAVLAATRTLAVLLGAKAGGRTAAGGGVGAAYFDARRVDHDLVTVGWQRLVYPAGRRARWTGPRTPSACSSSFTATSSIGRSSRPGRRGGATRARTCSPGRRGSDARGPGLNALGLPEEPAGLLPSTPPHSMPPTATSPPGSPASSPDPAPGSPGQVSMDAEGRLHVAAITAVPGPASLVDLRARVAAMLPKVDLPELVLEVMSWQPQLVEAFTHPSGNEV